jgi:glycerophosphoryl diester phosphodiesterase
VHENPDWVRAVRRRGHEVHVWTVNDVSDLQLCVDLGVTAVITDRPGELKACLDAM